VQRITAIAQEDARLTSYSYPALFGMAGNNGYGLTVFAFLKFAGLPFRHTHIIDGDDAVGDRDRIISSLTHHRCLAHQGIARRPEVGGGKLRRAKFQRSSDRLHPQRSCRGAHRAGMDARARFTQNPHHQIPEPKI
jgi:hypothetical protein